MAAWISFGLNRFPGLQVIRTRSLDTYESKMGVTTIRNTFEDLGGSTRWTVHTEFNGKGIMRLRPH